MHASRLGKTPKWRIREPRRVKSERHRRLQTPASHTSSAFRRSQVPLRLRPGTSSEDPTAASLGAPCVETDRQFATIITPVVALIFQHTCLALLEPSAINWRRQYSCSTRRAFRCVFLSVFQCFRTVESRQLLRCGHLQSAAGWPCENSGYRKNLREWPIALCPARLAINYRLDIN